MKRTTKFARFLLLMLTVLLCGCAEFGNEFDLTETISAEELRQRIIEAEESLRQEKTAAPETTTSPETAAATEGTLDAATETDTVYWTKSGSVWHLSAECGALKQAKTILSGSVTDARAAGKERLCKLCE